MKYRIAMNIAAALFAAGLAGCNTTSAVITSPSGQVQRINNMRFAWSSEEYDFSFTTNGVWHASATKSNPDAATVSAITQLVGAIVAKAP